MCWNAKVSLNTFMIGLIGILYGYINKYPITELLLFLSFTSMQLVEYFIWTYYDNKRLNHIFTLIGALLIGIQPIMSMLMLKDVNKYMMYILLSIYLSYRLYKLIYKNDWNEPNIISYKGENGHLVWSWIKKSNIDYLTVIIFLICLLLPLLLCGKLDLFIYALITLVISIYYFTKYDTWTSMWCWSLNFWVLFIIIKDLYMKKI
jgi:hypothetical protein